MSTPLFLLLGLTIATCVIAYWADNLGKKLGKKRVTLFGLRPRQTATLITMFSSVIIMFFTLATLLIVNSGLRRALLHYDEERAANRQLRGDNKQLRDEQQKLKSQSALAQQATALAQKQAASAQKATRAANVELKKSAARLKVEQANLKTAQAQEKKASAGEKLAQIRARDADRRLIEAKRQLTTVEGSLRLAGANLKILNANLKTAQLAARQAQEGARTAKAEETSTKNAALAEARRFVLETRQQLEQVSNLQKQKESLSAEISRLEVAKEQLRNRAFDAQLGAVFAARTLPPRLSTANITMQMRDLIDEGERVLKAVNPNRSLRLVLPDDSTRLAPDDILNALVRYLTTFSGPVSVRLTSTRNHAEVESEIHAALMPVSARLVFPRNEIIAGAVIETRQSDARVFNQLLKLLNRGEALARDRGVAPLLKGDELFYSADTNERIFATLRRIQAANSTVTVHMIADADISAIDQLRVRFEVVTPEP